MKTWAKNLAGRAITLRERVAVRNTHYDLYRSSIGSPSNSNLLQDSESKVWLIEDIYIYIIYKQTFSVYKAHFLIVNQSTGLVV